MNTLSLIYSIIYFSSPFSPGLAPKNQTQITKTWENQTEIFFLAIFPKNQTQITKTWENQTEMFFFAIFHCINKSKPIKLRWAIFFLKNPGFFQPWIFLFHFFMKKKQIYIIWKLARSLFWFLEDVRRATVVVHEGFTKKTINKI